MKKKIVCELSGGLGNQMFCYASAYAVAKYINAKLYIDTSSFDNDAFGRQYELKSFNISCKDIGFKRNTAFNKLTRSINLLTYRIITENNKLSKSKWSDLIKSKRMYLDLFWHQQNYRLFDELKENLIKEFEYVGNKGEVYKSILEENKKYYTVSVHLRYGDYVELGCCLDYNYYNNAIKRMIDEIQPIAQKENKKIRLVVFSENIETSEKIIGKIKGEFSCLYISNSYSLTDLEEFWLMSKCDSNIISNSTFSWWAAYLNVKPNHIVIAPIVKNWMDNGCWEKEYFPKEWIKIETNLLNQKKSTK